MQLVNIAVAYVTRVLVIIRTLLIEPLKNVSIKLTEVLYTMFCRSL